MGLKTDILLAAKKRDIDPFINAFKPSDLGLIASNYGSFSDHCSNDDTVSGKWSPDKILKVVERKNGKPYKYILIN